jgi:hypothetical protein
MYTSHLGYPKFFVVTREYPPTCSSDKPALCSDAIATAPDWTEPEGWGGGDLPEGGADLPQELSSLETEIRSEESPVALLDYLEFSHGFESLSFFGT